MSNTKYRVGDAVICRPPGGNETRGTVTKVTDDGFLIITLEDGSTCCYGVDGPPFALRKDEGGAS